MSDVKPDFSTPLPKDYVSALRTVGVSPVACGTQVHECKTPRLGDGPVSDS